MTFRDANGDVTKIVAYEYDALGRLITKKVDDDADGNWDRGERHIHDASGKRDSNGIGGLDDVVLAYSLAGSLTTRYLHGRRVDEVLAAETPAAGGQPAAVLWALSDNQGTVRDLARRDSSTGVTTVTAHRTFSSFGNILTETNPATNAPISPTTPEGQFLYAYTGRHHDRDTNLTYNRARWTRNDGRFLNHDPLGFAAGDPNTYRYVGNNPTNATDPSGLAGPPVMLPVPEPGGTAWKRSRSGWTQTVMDKIGVSQRDLAGYNNFSPRNQQLMRKIYGYYQGLFEKDGDLLWAGMAKLAGNAVWRALADCTGGGARFPAGHVSSLRDLLERTLVEMNRDIFLDLAWQHEAYVTAGIEEIRRLFNEGEIDKTTLRAWELIDSGKKSADPKMIARGNEILLRREQERILTPGYGTLSREAQIPAWMSGSSVSPVPGGKPFTAVVPGGNLARFEDRWKWIKSDMLPGWLSMQGSARLACVQAPLGASQDELARLLIWEWLKKPPSRYQQVSPGNSLLKP